MPKPEVTIIIPNYKTPDLTRFCLRSLRLHSDPARVKVIVVDNDSRDDSVEYLRGVQWIDLIERHDIAGETAPEITTCLLPVILTDIITASKSAVPPS